MRKNRGQGGATAIEDAVALGTVLERGLQKDEVPARLKLYEKIRYERANRIQQYTRIAGGDVKDKSISLNSNYTMTFHEFR
jgi:2-polyprenyl-6-methoxyphenol hydroxylase-like FAD-dependent oxidoreductase